ncbi:hypothetical protein [Nocardioides limicola]|uniref:hypothetical protein n=1 Tax=Nocardioides limicola TaxID=2803368 RepID=UPI00193B4503|nr:hypothetical protein [Nocardioides sp. DJM-14]
MPKLVGELIYAAIEAGIDGLVSPGCALCGRPRTLFHNHGDGQRICTTCYSRLRVATCSNCGRDGQRIKVHDDEGRPVCARCHERAQAPDLCAGCGKLRRLKRSSVDGLSYCRGCQARRAPTERCSICGQDSRVNARATDGGAVCTTCYTKTRTATDVCDECGTIGPLNARADGRSGAGKNLCGRCYRHPKRGCGICGRVRRVALRATDTSPDICPTCYQAPVIDCSVCGQSGLGRRATKNGKPWCFACQATEYVDSLLATADGAMPPKLKDVRDVLVARAGAPSLVSNWRSTQSLRLLARLAEQPDAINHKTLDEEGNRFSAHYLRALLVATGVLPERDEQAARLDRWVTELLAGVEDLNQRKILTRYARWHVIARARPDRHGQLRPAVADRCRQEIRMAQRFLIHLDERGANLAHCRQMDIDSWITGRQGMKVRFLNWLQADGELAEVNLPVLAGPQGPGATIDQDQQWALVRRMLHDPTSASIEDRAAACLVLLYAQHVTTIVALTVDDIELTSSGTYLNLGTEPVELLPDVADLITALPIAKPFGAARTLADPKWPFPGKRAGHHQHSKSLMGRLNRLGIITRASRNTAMLHLAATVPPAVFASLVGIDVGTATRWAEHAGGNWTRYAAERSR